MTVREKVATRLRIERKRKGWSQIYVAARLKLGRNTTYSSWERGEKMPNVETLVKLADLYQVSADYLLGRINERTWQQEIEYNAKGDYLDFIP